jgi:cellulose synthase/poly-beta-1,6-N-acetylglucosamine synthase-like glycosyltransferase
MSWMEADWVRMVVAAISTAVIATGLAQNAIYLTLLVVSWREMRRRTPLSHRTLWSLYADVAPPIALLAPAYNEEATVAESVRSLLALQYPSFEVIVINDGSKDATLAVLVEEFGLVPIQRAYEEAIPHAVVRGLWGSPAHPRLLVVDKENGGKADALNAGINLSRSPLFCAVDADSLLEADSLLRAAQPFVTDPERTAVVGGTIRIVNGCEVRNGQVVRIGLPSSPLALFQTVEYLRAFLMARVAWSRLGALTVVSGAFGLFRRNVAVAVGGYSLKTVGEDEEIVFKINRHFRERGEDRQVVFLAEPVCWTEAPSDIGTLARQRQRWQRGSLETLARHKDMFHPRYGAFGMLGVGQAILSDVIAPPVEVLGYLLLPLFWALGVLSWEVVMAFLALTMVFGVALSVGALILEEIELHRYPRARDLAILTAAAVLENFGYRQLNNWWRLCGYWQWLRKADGWGHMRRTGFRRV